MQKSPCEIQTINHDRLYISSKYAQKKKTQAGVQEKGEKVERYWFMDTTHIKRKKKKLIIKMAEMEGRAQGVVVTNIQ